jgi:hypothetical protein
MSSDGLCQCGCGQTTSVVMKTDLTKGLVKGQHRNYLKNHDKIVPLVSRVLQGLGEPNDRGCREWLKGRCSKGYGTIGDRGRVLSVHRVVWEIHNGPIPDGLFVLHECDNPPCGSIDHLFLGTNDDNMADMVQKGRFSRVMSDEVVLEIRRLYQVGDIYQRELAERFGISEANVWTALRGKSWKHLDPSYEYVKRPSGLRPSA